MLLRILHAKSKPQIENLSLLIKRNGRLREPLNWSDTRNTFMSHTKSTASKKEPTEYTVKQKAWEEGWKLHYDTAKHLTTLSAGSILILIGFLEKIFVKPSWRALIVATLLLFLISIIGSIMEMVFIASYIRDQQHIGGFDTKTGSRRILIYSSVSFLGFLLGLFTLSFFAIKNLFT